MISAHVFIARNDGSIDGIIMGRGTYGKVLDFDSWPYTKPVVALSQTLTGSAPPERLQGKVRFLNLSPKEGWKRAYIDGGKVIQSFLREKLIAEIVLTRIPVLIGDGRSLFG